MEHVFVISIHLYIFVFPNPVVTAFNLFAAAKAR